MALESDHMEQRYYALANAEQQYSLWPVGIDIPKGWTVVMEGTRAECGAYVNRVWTDMRPRSLREHTRAATGNGPPRD